MSFSIAESFIDASQKITLFFGIPILIVGISGGLLNTIIFRSTKRFRQSSCVFYLTVMSIVNIGQLISGFLPRIMTNGFNIDWTQSSVFYCKFRAYCQNVCALISITCMSLATVDQFLATCSSHRWRKWSHIRVARTVIAILIFIWLIYETPYLIYTNLVVAAPPGKLACLATDKIFYKFNSYSSLWLFGGFLPILINVIFGILIFVNLQSSNRQTLPIFRRSLDRQLTMIVLVQVIYNVVAIVPFLIITILVVDLMIMKDPLLTAKLQFATVIAICLYFLYFASPFYMYICVSRQFRRQFKHLFCKDYSRQQRRRTSTIH